ncbi:MAG: family 20 glycosylhydrolase [Hyphomicrobiales bacterium]
MRIRSTLLITLIAISGLFFSCENKSMHIKIIPSPSGRLYSKPGSFKIDENTRIVINSEEERAVAEYLSNQFKKYSSLQADIIKFSELKKLKNDIVLYIDPQNKRIKKEGYIIGVDKAINIKAKDNTGCFYAIQSLLQLLPPDFYSENKADEYIIPLAFISDNPRFKYRGMHLDVCRHFFSVDFIKRYLDMMAMYKMNRFHWHLTEDQGWRIEIKKYPKLTDIGAWRIEKDGTKYGGYYTQEQIKEIVDYASKLNITVIPEIELPGHSLAALAAYPELSCNDGTYKVENNWGIFPDVYCPGKESTFVFLQNVLDEITPLFPSEYIHIGGDECPKTRWKKCPKCQKRIKDEKLKNEEELQSYFIQRIERYLNNKGKQIIGWDEILEGGLAPNATVMSWRGISGGIEAAESGHNVIMTPNSHCYFDHYQGDPEFHPKAIGGYTTLKKVYDYEPIPTKLSESEGKFILGAQGNVWTEYIHTPEHVEYMMMPRMVALSEILWTRKKRRNYKKFRKNLKDHFIKFDHLGINYCKGSYKVDIIAEKDSTDNILVTLESEIPDVEIRYSLNNEQLDTSANIYSKPFTINESVLIKAAIFENNAIKEKCSELEYTKHKGVDKKISFKEKAEHNYSGKGLNNAIDGFKGSKIYKDGYWQGFYNKDIVAVIDLEKTTKVDSVECGFIHKPKSWIFEPSTIDILTSNDGIKYNKVNSYHPKSQKDLESLSIQRVNIPVNKDCQYLKLIAKGVKTMPSWHPASGEPAYLFIDEIVIY